MTTSERVKLAKEIEMQAASKPAEWDSVPELVEYRYIPTDEEGEGRKKSPKGKKGDDGFTFDDLMARFEKLDFEIKSRENERREIKEALQEAVMISGREKIACRGYRLAMITKAGSKKIVAEKLLNQGVSAQVIVAATEVGKPTSYLDIRAIGEK